MFTRGELTPEAMRMLHDQSGVVSVAQLRAAGLSPKTIRRVTASWHRVARGVFLATTPTWQSAVWAGILVAGPTGIVGGVAACHLHGIVRDPPRRIVIWTRDAKPPFSLAGADVVFRRGSRERFRTPPRSKVETSIVDATTHVDQLELIDLTVRALARRHTTAARLGRELATRQRVRHGATIRTLCEKANDGLESVLE